MITLSVNSGIDSKEKVKRVAEIVQQINDYNREYVSDAFFNVAAGNVNKINLNELANLGKQKEHRDTYEFNSSYKKVSLLSEEEAEAGCEGVCDIEDTADFEMPIIEDADTEYFVDTFLTLREFIFFKDGYDIWRMLKLVRSGESWIGDRFRYIVDAYGLTSFFNEFCCNIGYVYAVQKILG